MIKLLVLDVDGTLTDGRIYIGPHGETMKAFDVRDGYGLLNILPLVNIIPVIITGRTSDIVKIRASELNIQELYQGVSKKLVQLKRVAEKHGVQPEEIAYIGDDLNDLDCIKYCSVTACPSDAILDIQAEVSYVCQRVGGRGAVREFIEYLVQFNNMGKL